MGCDGSIAMTEMPIDESAWERDRIADVPLQFLAPRRDVKGIVVVLPDPDWPDPAAWLTLGRLIRTFDLGAVAPDVRSWWIDRPDPALKPARSPLSFVFAELVPWIRSRWPEDVRLAALGVGFGGQGALQLAY